MLLNLSIFGFIACQEELQNQPVVIPSDIDNDGFPDIFMGAFGSDLVNTNSGMSLIYGSERLDQGVLTDGMAQFLLWGEAEGDLSGWSVSSAGDVNGDGLEDVIIGATENSEVGTLSGKAYILLRPME